MELTSTSNKTVVYAASLKEKKHRDKEGKYLIEGEHLVEMAGDSIECIFTTDHSYEHDTKPVYHVNEAIIRKLSFVQAPQGIIAIVKKKVNIIYLSPLYTLFKLVISEKHNTNTSGFVFLKSSSYSFKFELF